MDHEKHQKQIIGDKQVLLNRDLISQLPDDILVNMLSWLTLKEAGQTSILSPRWRYLWTSCPNLIFDASKIVYELKYNIDYTRYYVDYLGKYNKFREYYLNWVDQVVRSFTGPAIHEFMVLFPLDYTANTHIDQWIHFAFKKNVQRLTLNLVKHILQSEPYTFPEITDEAGAFHPILHRGGTSSSSLTSLKLRFVNVTGEVLQFLLSACPSLECLWVHFSDTLSDNFEARSISLKSLELQYCYTLTGLSVTAPNLLSFTYAGQLIPLELSYSPKLTEMSLLSDQGDPFIYNNPLELSNYFSQLEVLTLDIMEYIDDLTNFPSLARLKRLKVSVSPEKKSLLCFADVLKACPALCEVSFELYDFDYEPTTRRCSEVGTCPHHSLKMVELAGYFGDASDQLALYLIQNAVMLERIIFDTRKPGSIGSPREFKVSKRRAESRRRAMDLQKMLRPGVESVII